MKIVEKIIFPLLYLAFLLSLLFYVLQTKPHFSDVTLEADEHRSSISLPYRVEDSNDKNLTVTCTLSRKTSDPALLHITADDCVTMLKINGSRVDLQKIPDDQLCDDEYGFTVDASKQMIEGINTLKIEFLNQMGDAALDIEYSNENRQLMLVWIVLFILMFAGALTILQKLGLPIELSLLFALGIVARLEVLKTTPYLMFAHDVEGHLEYIQYVVQNLTLPPASECWECFQQPLYYLIAAPIYYLANIADTLDVYKSLQALSLFFDSGFLLFSLLILKNMHFSRWILTLLGSLIIFMPSSVLQSVRIGNDTLLYFAYTGALFFFLKWLTRKKGLGYALGLAVLALFTKTNGIIVMGVIGVSLVYYYLFYQSQTKRYFKAFITTLVVFASAALLSSYIHASHDETNSLIANAPELSEELLVENKPYNYLYFDLNTYLEEPFTDAWDDDKGRQYFWNFFLKSSLFNEFSFDDPYLKNIASIMGALYLLLIFGSLDGLLRLNKKDFIHSFPFFINGFLLLIGILYLRITVPASCSSDFRYVVPIMLSGLYFLGLFLEKIRISEYVMLKYLFYGITGLFSLLSLLFITVHFYVCC